jgi:hypothetical protein
MCPWCFLTPGCPCRRGGGPAGFELIGPALAAIVTRLRRRRPISRTKSGEER